MSYLWGQQTPVLSPVCVNIHERPGQLDAAILGSC